MIRVGIIGATGYTGLELVRTVLGHPQMELVYLSSDSTAGEQYSVLYPHLYEKVRLISEKYSIDKIASYNLDLIFIALPHGLSMDIVPQLHGTGVKIVDLGADFRIKDVDSFVQWYAHSHSAATFLPHAVYGLPEKHRDAIKGASLIANPGCYPTASILGVWPLVNAGTDISSIIIDAKSGISGAGKKPKDTTHFPNANESVSAYKVLGHQHTPEISQEVGKQVVFTPHLMPMTRGILATIYIHTAKAYTEQDVRDIYNSYYEQEPFVTVMPAGVDISTKMVSGSNNCFLQLYVDKIRRMIVVVSVIDNLIKGAAGQAVQNGNIMFGFPEKSGLSDISIYP